MSKLAGDLTTRVRPTNKDIQVCPTRVPWSLTRGQLTPTLADRGCGPRVAATNGEGERNVTVAHVVRGAWKITGSAVGGSR